MKKVKVRFKVKKLFSCLMALLLVMLSCDNGLSTYAAEPEAYALGDIFTEDILKYRIIDEDNKYVEVAGHNIQKAFLDVPLDIPATITHDGITYSVTRIGDRAFYESLKIDKVNIPDSVTEIGNSAFCECSFLYSVSIPNSVKVIDNAAFSSCTKLQNVKIPESVEKIGIGAFAGCSKFTSIIIPEGVKEICKRAFSGCWYVKTINLPSSLETIGANAFQVCGNDTDGLTVTMKEGVKEIGELAFANCEKIKEIMIPSSVENMGQHVFYGCIGLEKIIMKGGINKIPVFAFLGCESLKHIEIPDSVETVGGSAFSGCSSLESIVIPASITSFSSSYTFKDCTSLREMRIAVEEKKEDTMLIKPIFIARISLETVIFENVPVDRKLVFLNSDGTKELAGTSLVAAQNAYIEADDGDTTDNYWFGWEIGDIADLYTVTIDVKKDGEQWDDHGKKFLLKNKNGYLIDDFQAESGTYTVCVAVGETVVDTGVTVEVEDSDTSVTIEYFTVTFYDDDTAYENDTIWGQQIVRKDDYAIKPGSDPEKADFKFADWKSDKEGSEAFDFEAGITDTTNIYASWSEDSGASTEPTNPSETEKPTEPGKPSETENPTEPSKPADTENPTSPSKPTDTENPEKPTKPSGTENPPAPSEPSGTENPPAPSEPSGTENPPAPSEPSGTENLPVPSEPSGTENPPVPSKPSGTQKPTDPNNPADTETTITPNNPAGSETPSTPSPLPNQNGSPELEEPEGSAPVGEAEKGEKPKTGDTSHVEIYATAAMIAGLSYVMLMFAKHKEGMTEEEKNLHVSALIEWSKKGSRLRKYVALTAIFFLLLYYHSIGKQFDLEWKEICGN